MFLHEVMGYGFFSLLGLGLWFVFSGIGTGLGLGGLGFSSSLVHYCTCMHACVYTVLWVYAQVEILYPGSTLENDCASVLAPWSFVLLD
jgi:hypothetical protein